MSLSEQERKQIQRLDKLKTEANAAFKTGNFASCVSLGEQIMAAAESLPDTPPFRPIKHQEMCQALLNMSNACVQLKDLARAEQLITTCVERSEKFDAELTSEDLKRDVDQKQKQMLFAAVSNKCFILLQTENASKLGAAEVSAVRALAIAEELHAKDKESGMLFKALRGLAMVRSRQGRVEDCEDLFYRAYLTVKNEPTVGLNSLPAHQLMEELINSLIKRNALAKAEEYAREYYVAVKASDIEKDHLSVSDAAFRLADILCRTRGREAAEAEGLMRESLSIRKKTLEKSSPLLAMTMLRLAAILEFQNKINEETEALVAKALKIINKVQGPDSDMARQAKAHLQRIQFRRKGGGGGGGDQNEVVEIQIPEFDADDGQGRMQFCTNLYEQGFYSEAAVLLDEAQEIFARQYGENHELTQTARTNALVVRQKSLQKMFNGVLDDLTEEKGISTKSSSASTSSKKVKEASGEDEDDDDSAWKFELPPPSTSASKSWCVIC